MIPMQSDKDQNFDYLEKTINSILHHPQDCTPEMYIKAYNIIYTHCTTITNGYSIRGENIYDLLSKTIDKYCNKLVFECSLIKLQSLIEQFKLCATILEKILSYLERFYIKISILKDVDGVKRIRDLLYFKIYYNFVHNYERSLLSFLFLEMETHRRIFRHNPEDVKGIMVFYCDLLSSTGQSIALERFYNMYLDNYRSSTDFNHEIGKILKKVYLELYFLKNFITEKGFLLEIVKPILNRKNEVLDFVFSKIYNFESFKHVYRIINLLPDSVREEMKYRYEEFARKGFKSRLENIKSGDFFEELWSFYEKLKIQVEQNKLQGYNELIDNTLKYLFFDLSLLEQSKVYNEVILFHKNLIEMDNESRELSIFFDFFATISNELLISEYTKACQIRLLNGCSPDTENYFVDIISQRIGSAQIGTLKNAIMNYLDEYKINTHNQPTFLNITTNNIKISPMFQANLTKLSKAFWNLEPVVVNLNSALIPIERALVDLIERKERHVLNMNYILSPIEFNVANKRYKMSTDTFSMLMHIVQNEQLDVECLRTICQDQNFESNLNLLISNKIVDFKNNILQAVFNNELENLDIFCYSKEKKEKEELKESEEKFDFLIEAKICKYLKKHKSCKKVDIFKHIGETEVDCMRACLILINKEYIEEKNDQLIYIP